MGSGWATRSPRADRWATTTRPWASPPGAWEAVKRHFREIGIDTQTQDFTVVGIGDMSGDVFGNGMLLSKHIRLIAAFDHRHIFLDPNPDAAVSWAERRRMFELPRSSWGDYDRSLISEGGGVYSREQKAIPLSAQVRAVLGIDGSVDGGPPRWPRPTLFGRFCGRRWTCCSTAASALTSRPSQSRMLMSAIAPTIRCESTRIKCAPRSLAKVAISE